MKIWLIYIYLKYGYFGDNSAFRSLGSRGRLGSTCILVLLETLGKVDLEESICTDLGEY